MDRPAYSKAKNDIALSSFGLAPNPANQKTVLYYNFADKEDNKAVELYDFLGRKLLEFAPDLKVGQTTINCSKYAEGSYLILIKEKGVLVKQLKFIVRQK